MFNLIQLYADFEKAIHNDVRYVSISIEVKWCRIYVSQSWYSKIQQLELSNDYKINNIDISNFFLSHIEDYFAYDIMVVREFSYKL